MQKESARSDHPDLRKRPKNDDLTDVQNISNIKHKMDLFSALSDPINLIPFSLRQAFLDTSLEYP
jgi:hypothetical protein